MKSILRMLVGLAIWAKVASQGSDYYFKNWCGHSLQYLDDAKCAKAFPTVSNREWQCPVPVVKEIPEGYALNQNFANIAVDSKSLSTFVNDSAINLCLALTKRVANASETQGFSLYTRYFCAGDSSATVPFETWSSSKIFAMTNAAGHLRGSESKCSVGAYGLGGNHVDSKHGNNTLLGDLATVVCSYDTTAGYSSNSLSSYFHDLGWRERLHTDVLHTWLGAPSIQTLGGNYGEATPSDLGFIVHNSESDVNGCAADKDPWPTVYSNTISALTATEMTRRIIQHRELPSSMQFPNVTWEDMREIMYGAETSALFPGQTWGGMTADTGIFLQSAAKIQDILANDEAVKKAGQWRIFSKLGAGYSTSRNVGEIVTNAYGCLPSYDSESGVIVGGIEFTLTARGSIAKDYDLSIVDGRVQQAVSRAVDFIYEIN